MALQIGKARLYYTLWDINVEEKYNNRGGKYHVTHYTYMQNLSQDEDKAIEKALSMGCKDTNVDEELYGRNSSFKTVSDTTYEPYQFKFGKYEGEDIRESKDDGYLKWYFGESNCEFAKERFLELNDGYGFYDGYLMKNETIVYKKEQEKKRQELDAICENDEYVDVTFMSNISDVPEDEFNMVRTEQFGRLYINVESKLLYYGDFPYRLPLVKGKGKRIKNKTFKVNIEMVKTQGWTIPTITDIKF